MKNKNLIKKIFIIIISILIVISTIAIISINFYIKNKLNKINYVEIDENTIVINEEIIEEQEQLEGYRTIALFGIDSREDEYGNGNRSDCIILVILNQQSKEINLVSVYRDSYLKITRKDLDKVTHAYSYEGPELAISTLNINLDLDITEFVTVNFDAVINCIDALGGIEMEITEEELKYINPYINELNRVTRSSSKNLVASGEQHLDGVQALSYARIRYTAGGDYKRTERIRNVMYEIFEKVKMLNIYEINNLLNLMLPEVYTNINSEEIISILPNIATYKINQSIGWPYDIKGATIGGVWYGVPVTLESNVVKLHQEVYGQANYEPSQVVKEISNNIINKTGYEN